jgi:hypothetical protein
MAAVRSTSPSLEIWFRRIASSVSQSFGGYWPEERHIGSSVGKAVLGSFWEPHVGFEKILGHTFFTTHDQCGLLDIGPVIPILGKVELYFTGIVFFFVAFDVAFNDY